MDSKIAPRDLSRLEKTSARLRSQIACLGLVIDAIATMKGPVFELGLGRGRTYDHLRWHMPDRDIYAFDREIVPIEDCRPPEAFIVAGDLEETLPRYAARFAGQVVLANCDLGSYRQAHNEHMAGLIAPWLPQAVAPGGFVCSDLPLVLDGFELLPLPEDAVEGHYRIFRKLA
ncbi:MAG: class I SAM-dependent methyltransferase [Anderseniella sp.]|jgi:hypothetical protein|nr:class I SAM-dependent methyltransferase [Anderseniella sp.]